VVDPGRTWVGLRVLRSWSSRVISTGSVSPIASVVPSLAGKGPPESPAGPSDRLSDPLRSSTR